MSKYIKLGLMKIIVKALPKMVLDFHTWSKYFPQFHKQTLKMAYLLDHKQKFKDDEFLTKLSFLGVFNVFKLSKSDQFRQFIFYYVMDWAYFVKSLHIWAQRHGL